MKYIKFIYGLLILSYMSCSKEPSPPLSMLIFTTDATTITADGADCGGSIKSDGGSTITQRGICWSTSSTPTINDNKSINGSGLGSYSLRISGLSANTNCYVRAFATNGYGTFYGNQITFKTDISLAAVSTTNVSSITSTSALSGGIITSNGGVTITQRGVCWSTSPTPTTANSKTINGTGSGAYTSNITSLNSNTIYYIRAYATNSLGTSYGNEVSFTTSLGIPIVNTTSISSITSTTAFGGGTITSSGSSSISQRGVCWSTTTLPTIGNSKTLNGTGIGAFTSSISLLNPNTTYYVRAYATNASGTAYGNEISFSTLATTPTLTTTSATSINQTTAISGGNITSDGGASITQRGVCWSTSTAPTTSNNKTNNGTGTGSFSSNISGLISNTTYYVRAYATNSIGTAYGNEVLITTSANLATLTTSSVSSIAQTTAISGGNISSDGGATITQRGVCWNTSTAPTILNNTTNNGTGIGNFVSNITGLTPNTTYYVRAYATNSAGTKYGNEYNFITGSLGTPTLNSPSNFAAVPCCIINFSWSNVIGATSYEINVSKTIAFSGTSTTIAVCGGSSYPSLTLLNTAIIASPSFCMSTGTSSNNGMWYWRVRAKSGSTVGAWSSTFRYTYTF